MIFVTNKKQQQVLTSYKLQVTSYNANLSITTYVGTPLLEKSESLMISCYHMICAGGILEQC